MKQSFLILLLTLLGGVGMARATDYALINTLPQRAVAAKAKSQPGWDSGVTAQMKNATYAYNDALVAMIRELATTYYPKDFFTDDESVDSYVKALYTTRRFRQDVGDPSGDSQGTLATLEVPSAVSGDLEETIADMVEAIAGEDSSFNTKTWKKKWQAAMK